MRRDKAMRLLPAGLVDLLRLMHRHWRAWHPRIGYPTHSAGFAAGGAYTGDWEDFEQSCDLDCLRVISTAWSDLAPAERVAIEMVMGWMPAVATVRDGVLEGAVVKLVRKCQSEGVLI